MNSLVAQARQPAWLIFKVAVDLRPETDYDLVAASCDFKITGDIAVRSLSACGETAQAMGPNF